MEHAFFVVQDYQVAAVVIFAPSAVIKIAFIGTIANVIVATTSQRILSMRNSFGLLMTSQSTAEIAFCAIFAFYFSPMVFFSNEVLKGISHRFGMVLLMCYDICIFSHLFIALNRMCAICLPWKYDRYFSRNRTKILIVICWFVSITRCLISYGYNDCDLVYEGSIWAYLFTVTEQCKFISKYLDFYKDVILTTLIAIIDLITVIKVRTTRKQLRQPGGESSRRKKEINFLKQAILQGLVFAIELFTYFYLSLHVQNRWLIFACTTVAWNLVHCTDALIVIVFNSEFRKLLASPRNIFKSVIYGQTTASTAMDHSVSKH
ncbi:unnamed protein product [Cylicocyclus nassatus]|uniref:G-protein coupled receptors family 1 profile domain-containing protein n=1 Tax=Cylicocyclus nassatus TaxID=53992 RepID=A0AA36GHE5_CYLNA|nr:unnamed protein product [Cylicocyclus nassatus]